MITKIEIEEFLELSKHNIVFDVRSTGEYNHAHIPGAISLPIFSDEERAIIGTAYKQKGREPAIKIGLDFFGVKMRHYVEVIENIIEKQNKTILLHCWRGGMRSEAMAWLLSFYGFNVLILNGGYKSFRNWTINRFEWQYPFRILGGYTGSGKTPLLHEIEKNGGVIIDIEGIANHKGSAFGGNGIQPSQEMFENLLAVKLNDAVNNVQNDNCIWVEDESQRIGLVNLPNAIWEKMRKSPICFIDIPFEERIKHIANDYGVLPKQFLNDAIVRIEKRLGGLDAKNAINYLDENNILECFKILLKYYDKHYEKGLKKRENLDKLITLIKLETVSNENYLKIMG